MLTQRRVLTRQLISWFSVKNLHNTLAGFISEKTDPRFPHCCSAVTTATNWPESDTAATTRANGRNRPAAAAPAPAAVWEIICMKTVSANACVWLIFPRPALPASLTSLPVTSGPAPYVCGYRVGELQVRVDQRQVLVVQAGLQADDVVDDRLLHLSGPITDRRWHDDVKPLIGSHKVKPQIIATDFPSDALSQWENTWRMCLFV